jgi:flagellar P-ring protein precursor FlgI
LVTPLKGGDQQIYAVAQGPVSLGIGADTGSGGGGAKAFPTAGRVPEGATIEREIDGSFTDKKSYVLSLNHPDFTTSARLMKLINSELGGKYAVARDAGTIDIIVPFNYEGTGVELLASIENMEINPDRKARVTVNEKTGTVVIGESVRIDAVAVSHGDLTIEVAGAKGKGAAKDRVGVVSGNNLNEVVKALNAIGAKPQDMTAIFQALKASGALHAELEIL